MLCEKCGKNEATVYMKRVINGQVSEQHLCTECAGAQGVLKNDPFAGMSDFFEDFGKGFGGFFPGFAEQPNPRRSMPAATRCPVCGATAQDIARSGRAGCANCYTVFDKVLMPAIRRIHGDVSHTGAIPGSAGAAAAQKRRLAELKQQLSDAIAQEAFEDAARLRDEIRELEQGGAAHE